MLSFVQDVATTILIGYLSLTNAAAGHLSALIEPIPVESPTLTTSTPTPLIDLASAYEYGGAIPDILIQNSSYQSANLITATRAKASSSNDLSQVVVNIFCEYTTDEYIRTTTGSGYFISDTGVILTNAHVAQFLLLENMSENADTECTVRTGSPASDTYEAELLYISPAWILEHAALITAESPRGTGERDYALLYVTRGTDNQVLPSRLPYINPNSDLVPRSMLGDTVTLAGYPSTTIAPGDPAFAPRQAIATSSVFNLFTFNSNQADLFSLTGSEVGVSGMSGGPVVISGNEAVGLIVTRGDDSIQGDGSLNAITMSYINRTITEETGFDLAQTLSGDLPRKAKIFRDTLIPFLAGRLRTELE